MSVTAKDNKKHSANRGATVLANAVRGNLHRLETDFAPDGGDNHWRSTLAARFFLRKYRENTRENIKMVNRPNSNMALRKAASRTSDGLENSAVIMRMRRMAAIKPTTRNGSGVSTCSRNDTCTVERISMIISTRRI